MKQSRMNVFSRINNDCKQISECGHYITKCKNNVLHFKNDNSKFFVGNLKELQDYAIDKEVAHLQSLSPRFFNRYIKQFSRYKRIKNIINGNETLSDEDFKQLAYAVILCRLNKESIASIISNGKQKSNIIKYDSNRPLYCVVAEV